MKNNNPIMLMQLSDLVSLEEYLYGSKSNIFLGNILKSENLL